MLRVEEPLTAGVADVELLELDGAAPVVVPDDQGGLVDERRPALSQR